MYMGGGGLGLMAIYSGIPVRRHRKVCPLRKTVHSYRMRDTHLPQIRQLELCIMKEGGNMGMGRDLPPALIFPLFYNILVLSCYKV